MSVRIPKLLTDACCHTPATSGIALLSFRDYLAVCVKHGIITHLRKMYREAPNRDDVSIFISLLHALGCKRVGERVLWSHVRGSAAGVAALPSDRRVHFTSNFYFFSRFEFVSFVNIPVALFPGVISFFSFFFLTAVLLCRSAKMSCCRIHGI